MKLQPYRQSSIKARDSQKIVHRYFGSIQVSARVGSVAYKLNLLQEAKVHDVFHVSLLKKFHGSLPVATHIPLWMHGQSESELTPHAILDRRIAKQQNAARVQYLV